MRFGETLGSPITLVVENRDWKNWVRKMSSRPEDRDAQIAVTRPRPGHADLAGAVKYNFPEARYVLERASARESAARVAAGAIAKVLLRELGIEVFSHVIAVGGARLDKPVTWEAITALAAKDEVLLGCADPESEARMKEQVDLALRTGDSVGGIFEVIAHNVPPGLGTYANWDERLDAQLAAAVMSLQAVKAVEIGDAVEAAASLGSAVHDEIGYERGGENTFTGFTRRSNHAGGLEGGVSNGEDIRVRGYLKPISTLRRPLASVDFTTREPVKAAYERSDVCVVPAAGVAAEAMVALTIARAALEKFGGDSLLEVRRNFEGYCQQLRNF